MPQVSSALGYCYSIAPALPVENILFYTSNSIASLSILIGLALTIYGARKPRTDC